MFVRRKFSGVMFLNWNRTRDLELDTLENLVLAVIKKVKGKTKQQREVEEQKIIFKFDCVNQDLNRDYSFMSNYM